MPKFEIIDFKTEARPRFVKFKKRDIVSPSHTMANLTYDPYPKAGMDDTVRTEIIGRELFLVAKIKGEIWGVRPGVSLELEGHKFAIISSQGIANNPSGESTALVTGSEFLTSVEPLEVLGQLRRMLAASNPDQRSSGDNC
jgi:hypothetical protein